VSRGGHIVPKLGLELASHVAQKLECHSLLILLGAHDEVKAAGVTVVVDGADLAVCDGEAGMLPYTAGPEDSFQLVIE
jgi:hypothetical protein